jgi:hypothetical protein
VQGYEDVYQTFHFAIFSNLLSSREIFYWSIMMMAVKNMNSGKKTGTQLLFYFFTFPTEVLRASDNWNFKEQ